MSQVHEVVGFAVVGVFAVGWIWGLGVFLFRRGRGPGERFWTWLAVAQVTAGAQALIGIALLLLGRRPSTWLHYVYGFGPLLILAIAHGLAREGRKVRIDDQPLAPWVPFAFAAFICFGLTLRALMTGLGVG
jgi:hypothetical protein